MVMRYDNKKFGNLTAMQYILMVLLKLKIVNFTDADEIWNNV